ncbi:MAG: sulfide/dihydroorotate dehydrogenase-like FAD/NAD-binding protein [Nitrososphaerota archaeon]|nr:sulfide/dihydroorotate dehydrogenase-like FAD/NAD-binding protein [Nitrososphaerota archaeon]
MFKVNEILMKRQLASGVKEIIIFAPLVSRAAKAGQFITIMTDEKGERVPMTLVDWSATEGWIKIVISEVGLTTLKLGSKEVGETLYYLAGPFGNPVSELNSSTIILVGGGVGVPAIYPIARSLSHNNKVISIIGYKNANSILYEREIGEVSDEVIIATDDGSKGQKGFTSDALHELLDSGRKVDAVWVIGPAMMMKACSEVTRPYAIKTFASLNSITVCGSGMCGACRVSVGGKTKYTCMDGPEFDAHEVNWDELILRLGAYKEEEKRALGRYILRSAN